MCLCYLLNLDFFVFYRMKIFKESSHVIMSIILCRLLQYEKSDCFIMIDVKIVELDHKVVASTPTDCRVYVEVSKFM